MRLQGLLCPQANQAIETMQYRRRSCDCLVGPLTLGFNAETGSGFLKRDLYLPPPCVGCDDVGRHHIEIGAEKCLWVLFAIRVTDQHPSDGCWRVATPIPKSSVRYDLKRPFLGVIPARYDDLCPICVGRGQKAFGFGQCLAFDAGPT